MAIRSIHAVIEHVRSITADGGDLTDGELLGRFIERHDEDAFAALVKRHGRMVWGLCSRVLGLHDTEDAFQATFLVLLRKAATVVPREMVGNWLYGVAYMTAHRSKAAAAERRRRERERTTTAEPVTRTAVCSLLDEELHRLPDKYRAVLVLCELEGKSRKEVAQQLACPEGTVASRLARAKVMLARRLSRRGLVASAGTLTAILAEATAEASVPASVVTSTIRAVATSVVSPQVAALTTGVLKTMLISKLKLTTAVVFIVLAGVSTASFLPPAAGRPGPNPQVVNRAPMNSAETVFPGEWEFAGGQTGGITRVAIRKTPNGWSIQSWGMAGGQEIDQGKTTLHLLRDYEGNGNTDEEKTMNKYGFARWTNRIGEQSLTLRVENDRLLVEAYRIFTDKSDRPHYRSRYEFKKKG